MSKYFKICATAVLFPKTQSFLLLFSNALSLPEMCFSAEAGEDNRILPSVKNAADRMLTV